MKQDDAATEALAVIFAHAVMEHFDGLMGERLLCSPIVFEAALEVARVVFGPAENPIAALDEIEHLERLVRGGTP